MANEAIRVEKQGRVCRLILCRPQQYNTITPAFREELSAALDEADGDDSVHVVLLSAEGKAFCAGFGLDWATSAAANEAQVMVAGADPVVDLGFISRYAETWAKLGRIGKPTLAAVQGWCIAGGTDFVLHCDLIMAGEGAVFGYPPARVWGTPEAPWVWVARLGLEKAKRYLFTGDEIAAPEAARIGLILECVPDDELESRSLALAERMARLPINQLRMMKILCNHAAQAYQPETSRLLGCLFDGVARHTPEGQAFVRRSTEVGFRQAVAERDRPFGDYGERKRG